MESDSTQLVLMIVVLLGASGFLSMSETALTSIPKLRIRSFLDEGVKGAETLSRLKEKPDRFLTAILIGNNFVNILASTTAATYAARLTNNNSTALVTGIMTLLILAFGEVTPKTFATRNADKIAIFVAPIINVLCILLTPLIILLNSFTKLLLVVVGGGGNEKEQLMTDAVIKSMLDVGHEEGLLEHDEKRMLNNVVDFGDFEAKDVMTPRTKIVAADVSITYDELITIFKRERFSRLPIYEENVDNIIGILYVKDLFFSQKKGDDFNVRDILREAWFTYESKRTAELLSTMRQKRNYMVVVLDEYGGTSGIVTIEDLIEEIVGEIEDEYGSAADITHVNEHEYVVEGSTRIDEVNEMLGSKFSSRSFDSIGGFVIELLGRFPTAGEVLTLEEGVVFTIEEVDKNRIDKVRIIMKEKDT